MDHKLHKGKVLAALKEDNIKEIWTELFNEICFAKKAMFKWEFVLVIVKKVDATYYLCNKNKSDIEIKGFFIQNLDFPGPR